MNILDNFSYLFSYFSSESINRFPHQEKRNKNTYQTSSDDVSRPMHSWRDPSKRRDQWKNNEDSSEPKEFSIFVFYSPEQGHHRDTHRDCRMIWRKTSAWQEGIENGFFFEICQSEDKVRSRFINKILDTHVNHDTESDSYENIQRSYLFL